MNDRLYSYPKDKIKFLLIEGVHEIAAQKLKEAGYSVDFRKDSLTPEELASEITDVHVLGIRSKTKVTADHLKAGSKLLAVGCFGVGTNQVDLLAATNLGVPVFNAPYGNTRSVAELAIGNVLFLARKAADKSMKMHQGMWDKSAKGAKEIREKVLGIVGYGHIGQQVGILAEALGMQVIFYDQIQRLPLGNSRQVDSLADILENSDFITLHVPAKADNSPLIGKAEFSKMKKGACLLNLSRGSLIDFSALSDAIQSKQLGGAAIDVYPKEPKTNKEEFDCGLRGLENVILTPHLGGSTEEAQYNIGIEVAQTFVKFIDGGSTVGAVNFPQVNLPSFPESHRILNIHQNVPGVLSDVNKIISDVGANINTQYLSTYKEVGYLIMDINKDVSQEVKKRIAELPASIKTRILY
jgi:D-3-phosphoglycerate dehydrogenase